MDTSKLVTDSDIREGILVRVCCDEWMRHVNVSMAAMTGRWIRITKILDPSRDGEGRYAAHYYPEDNLGLPDLPPDNHTDCWAWRVCMFDAVSAHPVYPALKKVQLPDI